jgi:hypothetical protein
MTDSSLMKLGRKPARRDPRTLCARKYLLKPTGALPAAKPAVDWLAAVPSFPMYGNDAHGDCTIAAIGHLVQVWTANVERTGKRDTAPLRPKRDGGRGIRASGFDAGRTEVPGQKVRHQAAGKGSGQTTPASAGRGEPQPLPPPTFGTTPSEDEILRVYQILSPGDDGCVLLDVLNYWRRNCICGTQLGAYAAVNPRDADEVKVCLEIFGGLYGGAMLPLAAQRQSVWDVGPTTGPLSFAPGSWGGHCIPFGKYDARTVRCVTWGAVKDATWPWLVEYVDELYALISPDWLDGSGKTPEGLDLATLQQDLELVTS